MIAAAAGAVVTIENENSFGSGVIISSEGYIVTNCHVVKNKKSVTVKLKQNKKYKAEIVKVNGDYDLALLKISAEDLKTLSFGNSDSSQESDEVFAIGTPVDKNLGQSVTKGIISGHMEWNGVKFIQTDVSINPGSSGGPLLNSGGEIIGITTMKISAKGVEGIGFCISSNDVLEMLNIVRE